MIATGSDDAEINQQGEVNSNLDKLRLTYNSQTNEYVSVALRYVAVSIPPKSFVAHAALKFSVSRQVFLGKLQH